jgi:hypothetical protein
MDAEVAGNRKETCASSTLITPGFEPGLLRWEVYD